MASLNPTFTDEELQNEIWKPIDGLEGVYSVSTLGRIRRDTPTRGRKAGYILKPSLRSGYAFVTLSIKNRTVNTMIHQAVARAFIGPPPIFEDARTEINHKNGNKIDNKPSNLE